jgi:MFS family permease
LQKLAASKAAASDEKLLKAATDSGKPVAAATPPPPPKLPFDVGKFAGIFAAIGLALGAIGGILASLIGGILGLQFWQIPLAIIGLMLLISGPAMIVAWFKLKKRNLGPVLDANGWAINARARINIPLGTSLTKLARLPEGSRRSLDDPFAEKKTVWPFYVLILGIVVALVIMWQLEFFGASLIK